MVEIQWPKDKKFAFTIVDDTDNSTTKNIKPVYDYLNKSGIKTTKTVWVYPPRDKFTGDSLMNEDYLKFIKELLNNGFEIGLHNVGSGEFTRSEISEGFDIFENNLGFKPNIHINHASNKDNIYWGFERYQKILSSLIKMKYKQKRKYFGSDPKSDFFWGDICKDNIKYIRNHTFNDINTLKKDPQMPYKDKEKEKYSNYWFSSSDGHTIEEFTNLLTSRNIDKLCYEGGACIVYTHFASGFVDEFENLNINFKNCIDYLSSKDGCFVPAGTLLDFLRMNKDTDYVSSSYLNRLDIKWVKDRIIKKIRFNR